MGPELCIPTLTINHFFFRVGVGIGGGEVKISGRRSGSKNIISRYRGHRKRGLAVGCSWSDSVDNKS